MLVTESRVERNGTLVAEKIEVEADVLRGLLLVYKGIKEANANGTGYSPTVAEGMAMLKDKVSAELLAVL